MSLEEKDNDALKAQIAQLTEHNRLLSEKVDFLMRQLYGSKSEKLDPGQLELLLDPEAAKKPAAADCDQDAPAADPPKPKKRKQDRLRRSIANLPTKEELIVPAEVKAAPGDYRQISEEVSERLDVEPARYTRRLIRRPVYVRKEHPHEAPVIANLPSTLLEGSVLSASLLAHVLTEKFCYHQPFYRQQWRFKNAHGIELGRNTLCHWANHGAELLEPLYKLLAKKLRSSRYLQVDETPVDYQAPGTGKTRTGYFWVYHNPQLGVLYDWRASRSHDNLEQTLGSSHERFHGTLQCDGYSAYPTWINKQSSTISQAGCWAHVRRKFYEAKDDHRKLTGWILAQIAQLYGIEKRLREKRSSPRLREVVRAAQARPIYHRLGKALTLLKARRSILPKSSLGKAIHYALGQWKVLETYLDNGLVEIDNNLVENAVRPTKLGAKNWLFIGREDTGWRSAVIFTMVENCRRLGRDPFAYLKWVFDQLPTMSNQDDLSRLLPRAWAEQSEVSTLSA